VNNPTNDQIRDMLATAGVIAVVGHSDKPYRTSYQIAQFLRHNGYKVYPVNPSVSEINGEKSYASLADIPEAIDIVNVFRRPEHLKGVTAEAISIGAGAVWGQLGVVDEDAAEMAAEAAMPAVMDRCIKIEHQRLMPVR